MTFCTFTLNLQDVGVASDFKDLVIRFELKNYELLVPNVRSMFDILPPFKDFYPDANGLVTGQIIGNDVISPAGTYYTISFFANGNIFYRCDVVITGTTIDLATIDCLQSGEIPTGFPCLYFVTFSFMGAQMVPNQILGTFLFPASVSFPAGLTGWVGSAGVPSSADTIISINKNGVPFGTITFHTGNPDPTIVGTAISFTTGDTMTLIGPTVPDSLLADITITAQGAIL